MIKGPVAEWLGKALQKLLHQFESGRDLTHNIAPVISGAVYFTAFMINKYLHYTGIIACLALIAACFMPWVHYNNINETFTGFHVTKFSTGNYYGKAGITITVLTLIILLCMLLPKMGAKRLNLFIGALLVAYCIRTYIIFTSALFEGEVVKQAGIYLVVILPLIIMVAAVFPNIDKKP